MSLLHTCSFTRTYLSSAYFAPQDLGMLNPSSDGRVLFALPWMGKTLVGTTGSSVSAFSSSSELVQDSKSFVTPHPVPTEQDIEFIIQELRRCLNGDVLVCHHRILS
jgi:glycerol-3-phosphate dehydrogenase